MSSIFAPPSRAMATQRLTQPVEGAWERGGCMLTEGCCLETRPAGGSEDGGGGAGGIWPTPVSLPIL